MSNVINPGVKPGGTILFTPASLPVATRILTVTTAGVMQATVATTDFDAAGTAAGLVASEAATRAAADSAHDTAIALKAPLASPTFTGTPAAPTAANGTNTTQIATTAFVLANAVATPGGSSGQVQYNNAGSFAGFAGLTVSASSPNNLFTAQGTTHVAARAKGAVSHGSTTPIFDVVNSSDAQLFAVLPGSVQVGPVATPRVDFRDSNSGSGAAARNYIDVTFDQMRFFAGNAQAAYFVGSQEFRIGNGAAKLQSHDSDLLVCARDESSQRNMTVRGGDRSGTNVQGGSCINRPGTGTGNAAGSLYREQGTAISATSGTTSQTVIDRSISNATKVLTNNSATAIVNATLASGSVAAGIIRYAVEVQDGTDYQIETGCIAFHVTNKGGTIANNTANKFGNQQAATSGTLTVTPAISAANPAVISINANSSLTPSTGFPRITYTIENLTQQAIAIQ